MDWQERPRAASWYPEEIVRDYLPLSVEDIEAAVAFGSVSDTNE
jgi:uncharacterized protein (DUF433 family)